jgi:flagellar motor protein MotB
MMNRAYQIVTPLLLSTVLSGCVVWKSDYDALQQQNDQLRQQLAASQQQTTRLRGAIKYTVYTDNAPIGPALQKQGVMSNQDLSQRRADAVMQFLISQGVNPSLVEAKGFGDADPVASNDTAQGRAKNRRVELALENG